ncbi:MAG: peptide ABC transporter substrate-binding protein [Actinobacteria bacterium]|nr:peptide ABC transporter substrate-binding protein [Actinomycetota bacterium]
MMQGAKKGELVREVSRRQFLFRAAGGAVVMTSLPAILDACTQAGQSVSPAPSGGSASSTATLRVGWSSEPDTMNPLTSYSTEALEIQQLIYDKLFDYDANLGVVPSLATSSDVSSDGLQVTYHLREGVTWHDGTPFSAEDVVFTYSLISEKGVSAYAQWLTAMKDVTSNGSDVVVTFHKPQAFDPGLAVPIMPKHIWNGMTPGQIQKFANDTPVGTGPYRFGQWQRGQTVSVTRNDTFWGSAPGPASIIWVLFQNEDVMAQSVRAADVDILTEVPPTIWDGLGGASGVKAVSLPGFSFHHIGINVSTNPKSGGNPLLLDKSVRQAMSYGVDRNQLVQIALAGHGREGSVLLPPALGDYMLDVPEAEQLNANPNKAMQLLDAAGYKDTNGDGVRESPDGTPLEFRLIAIESTTVDVRAAQLFRDAMKKIGIKLDLNTMDENTLGSTVYNADAPDWDIFVWGWDSGVNDPDYLLGVPLTNQIGNNNDVYYANPSYDALYDQQAAELDHATRVNLVHETQQMFYEDCAYIIMWYQDKLQAYRSDLWTGFTETPGGIIFNFTRANYTNATPA